VADVLPILLAMLVIVGVAGLVLFYVAYPHRGETPEKAEWLGDALARAVDRFDTLDETDGDAAVRPRPERHA
jgi:hypothetical protein